MYTIKTIIYVNIYFFNSIFAQEEEEEEEGEKPGSDLDSMRNEVRSGVLSEHSFWQILLKDNFPFE